METTEDTNSMSFLLPGYRFNPTRQELALYLERKIAGLTLLPPYMTRVLEYCNDVYGDESGKNEPWNVFGESTERDYFFVFTYLKNVSPTSKRINRKAGIGTWHGRTAPSNVTDFDGKLIAFNRYFTFDVKGSGGAADASGIEHGHWTMHEFSLPDRQSPGDLVLCVIGCNKMISIADEPNSSINFAKYFSRDDRRNATASTSSNPYSNLGLLSNERGIPRRTSRKPACNSGYSFASIDSAMGAYQYSTTANCYQNQNLLPMSHNVGFMESSQSVFEQTPPPPMVMHPFLSGFEDGYGGYFPYPIFQQMLQSNDGVHEGSHADFVPITMQSPSHYSLLTEQNPFFSGFEDTPQLSTEFSISTEAAKNGEGRASATDSGT